GSLRSGRPPAAGAVPRRRRAVALLGQVHGAHAHAGARCRYLLLRPHHAEPVARPQDGRLDRPPIKRRQRSVAPYCLAPPPCCIHAGRYFADWSSSRASGSFLAKSIRSTGCTTLVSTLNTCEATRFKNR